MANSASSSGRSWFEGTLDVISGMAPRPSTPVHQHSHNNNMNVGGGMASSSSSNNPGRFNTANTTPNSPARPRGLSTSQSYEAPELLRLPSQDSVDRSIHNDSGHGHNKSNAQIIRDLRQSNARLTARTAALEADFMNQLSEQTRSATSRQQELEETLKEKQSALLKQEARNKVLQQKWHDDKEALQRFKEESAFHRHTISDLKSQLRQAQDQLPQNPQDITTTANDDTNSESNTQASWRREKEQLLERLQQLQREVHRGTPLPHEGNEDSELARTQQALHRTEQALHEMQSKAIASQSQHFAQMEELEEALEVANRRADAAEQQQQQQPDASNSNGNPSLSSDASNMADLQQTVLELREELSAAEARTQTMRQEFSAQESWRKEEADDLRVLNDAQDEEISNLRAELKHALQEMELVQHELEEKEDECLQKLTQQQEEHEQALLLATAAASKNHINHKAAEETAAAIDEATRPLQERLEEQHQILEQVKHEWNEASEQKDAELDKLAAHVEELSHEKQTLLDQLEHWEQREQERQQDVSSLQLEQEQHIADLQNQLDQFAQEKEAECQALAEQHEADAEGWMSELERVERQHTVLQGQIVELEQEKEESKERLLEANRRIASYDLDNAQVVQDHKLQIKALREKKDAAESELQSETKQMGQQIAQLEQQLADVQEQASVAQQKLMALEQQQTKAGTEPSKSESQPQDTTDVEELRKQVSSLTQSEAMLQVKIRSLTNEKEKEAAELKEKLQDRDTTISALVKSSVTLEQQIASNQIEMDLLHAKLSKKQGAVGASGKQVEEEGVDVILAKGEDIGKLKSSLDALKETETRLSNEVFRLKRQLHHSKLENGRLRQKMIDNNNNSDKDDENSAGGASHTSSHVRDRDEAIAKLVKQSMTQDETIAKLKKKLQAMEKLQQQSEKTSSTSNKQLKQDEIAQLRQETEMFAGQVIEQDEEIESLKKRLAEQGSQLGDVEQDARNFKKAAETARTKLKQAEADVAKLEARLTEVSANHQNGKGSSPEAISTPPGMDMERLYSLEAEVDELREANSEQLTELRMLRRKAHDAGTAADELSNARADMATAQETADRLAMRVDALEQELEDVKQQRRDAVLPVEPEQAPPLPGAPPPSVTEEDRIMDLQNEIVERDHIIGELKKMASSSRKASTGTESVDEMELEGLYNEIDVLKQNLVSQEASLESARETIRELERMSAEQTEMDHARYEEEKEEMLAEVEELTRQLDEAQATIDQLRKDEEIIQGFKDKLEQADEDREMSERTIVDNYERKLSLLTLDKDVLVDKLRKDLATEKEANAALQEDSSTQVTVLEAQMKELAEQAKLELQERNTQIVGLEQTLDASKQLIENMRTEMDHLQGSMVNATAGRREEIEDMQQELVTLTATAARQERELNVLRQELKDKQSSHESEVAKLQETIELLESQRLPDDNHRNAQDLAMELKVKEIKDRLDKLKWRNNSLQEENQTLRERLEKTNSTTGAQPPGSDAEMHAAQEKIASLQLKVAEQSKRIQNLEAKLEKARSTALEPPAPTPVTPPAPGVASVSPSELTSKKQPPARSSNRGFFGRRKSELSN